MKALTLTQPWASLVERQAKCLETRSWYTAYRGRLVIHAAKGFPGWCQETACEPAFQTALGRGLSADTLPRSAGLCVVTLLACVPTTAIDKLKLSGIQLAPNEMAFGDFSPGRWAWALRWEYSFRHPVPACGMLGLWEWPHSEDSLRITGPGPAKG
jgi:hypothetical protein